MKRFVIKGNAEAGLTLIELLLTIVISTICLGIIYAIFINGLNNYKVMNKEVQLRNEGDYILAMILNDMFEASPDEVVTLEPNKKIEIKQTQNISVDPDGVIIKENVNQQKFILKLENNNIYINDQKLNSDNIEVVWNDPLNDSSIVVKPIGNIHVVELTLKLKYASADDNFRIEPLVQKSTFGF